MSGPAESSEEEFIGGTIAEGAKVRETREVVQYVDGVLTRKAVIRISFASCGHPIQNAADLGKCQVDDCRNIPCGRCFRLCARCQKGLCNTHQKLRNGIAFCNRCRYAVTFLGWRGSGSTENQGRS